MTMSRKLAVRVSVLVATTLAGFALAAAVAAPVQAQAGAVQCPTFQVLHNDQIGSAVFPKGTYSIRSLSAAVPCSQTARLFAQFLQDYDGNLPKPWRVIARGSGQATFNQGSAPGFSVALISGPPPTPPPPPPHGAACPGSFQVQDNDRIGRVAFPAGGYKILIPRGSIINCPQASKLFARFLQFPDGNLPKAWRIKAVSATFFKPANPQRKLFRVDPAVSQAGGL